MSRNNLQSRSANNQHLQGAAQVQGPPTQITGSQYIQPQLEKLYWERSPMTCTSANYIRTSIPQTQPALPQNAGWSPLRQPVMPYQAYSHQQQVLTNQIHNPPDYIQAASSSSPYFTNSMMVGNPSIVNGPAFIPRQFLQPGSYYAGQQYTLNPHYEQAEMTPGSNTQIVNGMNASMPFQKNSVSLGTPAVVYRGANSTVGVRVNHATMEGLRSDIHVPTHVEEVEEEVVVAESPQNLPPVPSSARNSAIKEQISSHLSATPFQPALIPTSNGGYPQVGSLTARPSPSRLTVEAPGPAPATDRTVIVNRHTRTSSSPATMSPREHTTFITGLPQNLTSDMLKVGMFWPVLNPLIDMLRLIEVVDYQGSNSFKSILLAISPDSSVKQLMISFGETHELFLTLDPVEETMVSGLALIKSALKEEDCITMKSVATGNFLKISLKQLLVSGLTACQGKYLLSDTEYVKFGVLLSFSPCPPQAGPLVCVCPQTVHYELRCVAEQAPPPPESVVVAARHVRELSADCVKSSTRPISSAKLVLEDGMPAFNRLLVKIEGFEGFEDLPLTIQSVYLRASLGGGTKGYRCKVENWRGDDAHAEFDFDYRGNRTIKFSIINADNENKDLVGTTQLNLLALLALSKNQFHGSLPVNFEGQMLGRLKVGVLFTNASTTEATLPAFKAFSWPQALIGGSFIKITLHSLQGSLQSAHDPLFFRVSCGGVKVRSAKFTPNKAANSLDLKDEIMELPVTAELLAASEQKDFILCVYSRYNAETSCHTASHYVKILPSVIDLPSLPPRVTKLENAIMTPASQEFAGEDFLVTFTFGVHK